LTKYRRRSEYKKRFYTESGCQAAEIGR